MSAKRQKLRHQKIPLSETFLTEDTAYVPPSSLRFDLKERLRPHKRAPKETPPRRVFRPLNENQRDPFHTLSDDEVHLIIALLPAGDTETLRRVSKLWKASSEYHCGKAALVRHFPWAAEKANRCETREAANLQFRRCLHYQKNLEAGLATRAFRFDGASDWDIHGNRLIWSRGDETISIRDLRSSNDKSIIESEVMSLDVSQILPENTSRLYVRSLPGGDFLMTTLSIKQKLEETHRLTRISARGAVLWSVDLDASMSRPAIGKDSVYFIRGPCHKTSNDSCKKLSFAKHRLCDGSKIFDVTMPSETQANGKIPDLDRSLVLTGNESLASWTRHAPGALYIFSTSSGQLLRTMDRHRTRHSPLLQSVAPSSHTTGFWTTTAHYVILTMYDEASGSFKDFKHYYADGDLHYVASPMAFDGNRFVFLRTLHSPMGWGTRDNARADPFSQFAISPAELASANGLESPEGSATVTLPGRSKADGKRRELELELPWELEEGDFFGMMNDYFIYQSPKNEFLILVDFWPIW